MFPSSRMSEEDNRALRREIIILKEERREYEAATKKAYVSLEARMRTEMDKNDSDDAELDRAVEMLELKMAHEEATHAADREKQNQTIRDLKERVRILQQSANESMTELADLRSRQNAQPEAQPMQVDEMNETHEQQTAKAMHETTDRAATAEKVQMQHNFIAATLSSAVNNLTQQHHGITQDSFDSLTKSIIRHFITKMARTRGELQYMQESKKYVAVILTAIDQLRPHDILASTSSN